MKKAIALLGLLSGVSCIQAKDSSLGINREDSLRLLQLLTSSVSCDSQQVMPKSDCEEFKKNILALFAAAFEKDDQDKKEEILSSTEKEDVQEAETAIEESTEAVVTVQVTKPEENVEDQVKDAVVEEKEALEKLTDAAFKAKKAAK